jgi:UTP--glucose-1-phosphate uridylyltransferase
MSSIDTAVFPVAGLNTQLLPITKSVPNEMLPLIDKPLVQFAVEEARASGIRNFIFVSSPDKPSLDEYFRTNHMLEMHLARSGNTKALDCVRTATLDADSHWIIHQNEQRGLGHAIWTARAFLSDKPFAVILPDDFIHASRPALAQMIEMHERIGGNLVASKDVGYDQISKFGCLDIEARAGHCLNIANLVEKPSRYTAPSSNAVIGRYILQPSVLRHLEKTPCDHNGKIELTDAIAADLSENSAWGIEFEGQYFDCGTKDGFVGATLALAQSQAHSDHATLQPTGKRSFGLVA